MRCNWLVDDSPQSERLQVDWNPGKGKATGTEECGAGPGRWGEGLGGGRKMSSLTWPTGLFRPVK